MASPVTPALVYRRRSRALRILFASAGVGLVLALVIFFGVGRWLVVEDRLAKARAIVVLSGAMPMRAVEAAKLYREGYAPEIWLTHPTEPAETLERMGIPFAGEDHYNTLVLIHEGVPAQAIRVLEPPIVNTAEIKVAASALAPAKGAAVILSRQKLTCAAALVAKPERCSRCSARSFGSVKRLDRPAPAFGAMILDFKGKEK
jgi:hypothetical protein